MASTSNPVANKGKAPALRRDNDDDRHHHDMVMKMMMMRKELISMGIPSGWRFRPTDGDLITFYVRNITWNNSRIIHLDIYDFTPNAACSLRLVFYARYTNTRGARTASKIQEMKRTQFLMMLENRGKIKQSEDDKLKKIKSSDFFLYRHHLRWQRWHV